MLLHSLIYSRIPRTRTENTRLNLLFLREKRVICIWTKIEISESPPGTNAASVVTSGLLLEKVKQHRVSGYANETHSAADHGTHNPFRFRRLQSCDFIQDLLSPALANLISALVDGIRVCGVVVNPVKNPNISQFFVELCQRFIP